jgi:hypothetical protein
MKRSFRLLGQGALLFITWGAIFEIGLRLQQYFGPIFDLEMASVNLDWESNELNHKPEPKNQNLCIYGDLTGFTYERSYDANDDENTLPYQVSKYFRTERGICLKAHNAGYTSYAPSIFIPQAKKLLPIVRPDYIVVDVDETDLFDDFARYRKLIVRNERGQNVGVKVSPIGHECSVGLMQAREHTLYLMRFVAKAWMSLVHMPEVIKKYRTDDLVLFGYSQDQDANLEQKYAAPRSRPFGPICRSSPTC